MEIDVESMKGQYGWIHILSWSEFAMCAFDKNWSMFSKWQYRLNHIAHDSNFLKTFETENKAQKKGQTVLSLIQFFNQFFKNKKYMSVRWAFI